MAEARNSTLSDRKAPQRRDRQRCKVQEQEVMEEEGFDDDDDEEEEEKDMEEEQVMLEVNNDLDAIIDLQASSGIFKWGPVLERVLGRAASRGPSDGFDADVWLTALVVAYLAVKMPERKALWELVAVKARKCLRKKLSNGSLSEERLFELADGYVKTHT